jgi:hypothetical protein
MHGAHFLGKSVADIVVMLLNMLLPALEESFDRLWQAQWVWSIGDRYGGIGRDRWGRAVRL